MKVTNSNYFSPEAARAFWSVSQFKAFNKCEAAGVAEALGEYTREENDALLIGSYVDAYFSGEMETFTRQNGEKMFTKRGGLYAKFQQADDMIAAIERQPLMVEYLQGEKQVVRTAELFGIPWKIKMDVYNGERIVDLKTVRDFKPIWDERQGMLPWIEFWGYDIQGAVYQKIEQLSTGREEPLPFYIAAVTKEKTPDVDVIQIPQYILDAALKIVEARIERFDLIKSGDVEPIRCERCDFCKATKRLTAVHEYDRDE